MDYVISIVIPFYCTPKILFSKCMDSILAVNSDEIEIIVIDDGSPKDFYPVLESYLLYPQVKVIHIKNSGVSVARNRGITEASGKWVLFADSDDYMSTEALQKVLFYAKEHVGDIVIFSGGQDYSGKISYNTTFLKEGVNYASSAKDRLSIMESALAVGLIPKGYKQYFTLGAPYCKLIRTVFLRENDLKFDIYVKFAEDTLFSLNVYQKAEDIRFVNLNLYYYVFYPQSATRRFRPGLSVDMDVFFEHVATFLKKERIERELETAYYTRVQFEIGRALELEFFNPRNSNKNRKKEFKEFIGKHPYRTAIRKYYFERKDIKGKIKLFLIKNGYGRTLILLKKIYSILR